MAFADITSRQSASRLLPLLLLAFGFSVQPGASQDFNWSWDEKKGAEKPEEIAPAAPTPQPVGHVRKKEFNWSWDGGDADKAKASPDIAKDPEVPTPRIRDDEAYQNLLKENLKLRREIAEAMKDEELARKENARLAAEIQDMERNLGQSVEIIKTLKLAHDAASSPDQGNELEVRLAEAEKAKEDLAAELDRLKRLRDSDQADSKPATAGVLKDSDLFQERERENVLMKQRLGEIESERRRLEGEATRAKRDAIAAKEELAEVSEKALAAARQGAQYKKIVDRLPEIEQQVTSLKTDVALKDEKLSARQQQLEALQVELERREYRLSKAQKMADLLEKTRSEILEVNNREKLDMHYNMAVIYSKEGRPRDAEAEYLKALRIDPSDAEIHYNLGILYEQDLKDPKKAAMHYRRYLAIRPNASDVDQVKSWIMDLDVAR